MDQVKLIQLKIFQNKKGNIYSLIKPKNNNDTFKESYVSEIKKSLFKGWTFHKKNTLNLILIKGSIYFIFYDSNIKKIKKIYIKKPLSFVIKVKPKTWFGIKCGKSSNSWILNIMNKKHSNKEYIRDEKKFEYK